MINKNLQEPKKDNVNVILFLYHSILNHVGLYFIKPNKIQKIIRGQNLLGLIFYKALTISKKPSNLLEGF